MMELDALAADAAKEVTAGSVVPGAGRVLGAVGGIVLDLAPEIGRWLFGPEAAPVVSAVQTAIGAVTGTDDPGGQVVALADPEKAMSLRVALARIAADRAAAAAAASQSALIASFVDVSNARATTLELSRSGSQIAWGAPAVSLVVLVTFAAVVIVAFTRTMPSGAEPVLNVLLGTLGAMATSVVGYWVGSSAGSARKDERLANLAGRS